MRSLCMRRVQRKDQQLKKWMKVQKAPGLQLVPLLIVHPGYTACRAPNPPNQIRPFVLHNTAGKKDKENNKKDEMQHHWCAESKALPKSCWWSARNSQGRGFYSAVSNSCLLNTNLMSFFQEIALALYKKLGFFPWGLAFHDSCSTKIAFIKTALHCSFICGKNSSHEHLEVRNHFLQE